VPQVLSAPGLYVEEIPSGVHAIVGTSTSNTAFVDYFPRGPVGVATQVTSLAEFQRTFGGPDPQSAASYSVIHFFLNGGQLAWIVRVTGGGGAAASLGGGPPASPPSSSSPPSSGAGLNVAAASPGSWGNSVQVLAAAPSGPVASPPSGLFNLYVREVAGGGGTPTRVVNSEVHLNLSSDPSAPTFAPRVINASSDLITFPGATLGTLPALATIPSSGPDSTAVWTPLSGGADPQVLNAADEPTDAFLAAIETALTTGSSPLDRIAPFHFELLCVPVIALLNSAGQGTQYQTVADTITKYCQDQRAFAILDPPLDLTPVAIPPNEPDPDAAVARVVGWFEGRAGPGAPTPSKNGALYYPAISVADPLLGGRPKIVPASGALAGIYARIDSVRGTWKAPAGIEATVAGAAPALNLNTGDSASMNPLGLNALRTFPGFGSVVWGARTLVGSDQMASEWKYVPVRRMALYIESSLVDGLNWVVFEPNDEPLWSQIRLNVGTFMHDLFRQGAFEGTTPTDAYLVRCDRTTTTQSDIDKGVVNIYVGFAPLKPAEFVVLQIQQLAGQTQA
jgi:uncharacterized protein